MTSVGKTIEKILASSAGSDLASVLIAAGLGEAIVGGGTNGSFGRSIITYGGIAAIAAPACEIAASRVQALLRSKLNGGKPAKGIDGDLENIWVVRGACAFAISYGLLLLAGTSGDLRLSAIIAGSVLAGDFIHKQLNKGT